jgi:hypothetical protein
MIADVFKGAFSPYLKGRGLRAEEERSGERT